MESYRTERGPRKRLVAYLSDLDELARDGLKQAALHLNEALGWHQFDLFESQQPEWVTVDVSRVRIENMRGLGGPWLGLEVLRKLGVPEFLQSVMPATRANVDWATMALILVLARFCDASSELHIAEHSYEKSGLSDLLGVPAELVNDDRLYRALDHLLPHKEALEGHLKARMGELFDIEYDLLLYDVTSTFFEGSCSRNPQAKRGYSRDQRSDCKQITIALVVTREGLPLGYQVFDGNRADVTTVKEVVERIEKLYGRADRIWVMDRGMVSEANIEWLRQGGRHYIIGTPKSQLRKFESVLLDKEWKQIREGLEVKLCKAPPDLGDPQEEVFILCRSADRRKKELAMHEKFATRIQEGLQKITESCERSHQEPAQLGIRIGRLLGENSRAAGLFDIHIESDEKGHGYVRWSSKTASKTWARLSSGCYMLRSNLKDWEPDDLWKAYIQLTQAEAAFRIHKQDLSLRPVWHQRADRVQAHVLVCFLGYVVWKTLAMLCRQSGLGDEPRKVLDDLKSIGIVDVVLPTSARIDLRRRVISQPDRHQAILLYHLGLNLPRSLGSTIDRAPFGAQQKTKM